MNALAWAILAVLLPGYLYTIVRLAAAAYFTSRYNYERTRENGETQSGR